MKKILNQGKPMEQIGKSLDNYESQKYLAETNNWRTIFFASMLSRFPQTGQSELSGRKVLFALENISAKCGGNPLFG